MLPQYAGGQPADTEAEAHAHYDQIHAAIPQQQLGPVIGPALNTLPSDQVRDRIAATAAHMTSTQRGSLVQTLIEGLGPQVASVLSSLGLDPALAQNPSAAATPADTGTLAAHVQQQRPEIFNQAMAFYAQHPILVKMLGTLAIARIAQQLNNRSANGALRRC